MKAIETFYNGILFRSRLESTWASFFDELGWKWQYEPYDLDGWIPDFIIIGDKRSTLVEVKPFSQKEEWYPVIEKCLSAQKNCEDEKELLLLGISPFLYECYYYGPVLGLMNERTWFDGDCEISLKSFEPCVFNKYDVYGFFNSIHSYEDRVTGLYEGDHFLNPPTESEMIQLWNKSKNINQWNKI